AAAGGCSSTDEPRGDSTVDEIRDLPGPAPYFVGETFEELPLTAILGRTLPLSFIYEDCEPPPDEGGCPAPLEVQVSLIERLPPGMISEMIECRRVTVRGVEGAFVGADGLHLYVGNQTVVIFADSAARALRAAEALRPADADRATGEDLPAPSVDVEAGLARCSAA
ncbi:MAG: hypothetical protein ACRDNG_12675, partial [Gaiellaceae bacterium]